MSCPSCQVGGRRLPLLPLPHTYKKGGGTRHIRNIRNGVFLKPLSAGSVRDHQAPVCAHSPPLEDHNGMMEYLVQHPNVVEEYVLKNISQNQVEKWLIRKSYMKSGARVQAADLCTIDEKAQSLSQWKFCVHKDKRQLLDRLTKDIDTPSNCKQVVNEVVKAISEAIHSSRHTLYLVDDTGVYMSSYSESTVMDCPPKVQIAAASHTVASYVATNKENVFVVEILGDDRFPAGTGPDGMMDLSVIAFPLLRADGTLFGVVQFVRDANSQRFQDEDMEISRSYMSWCSLAVHYAEMKSQVHTYSGAERFIRRFGLEIMEQRNTTWDMMNEILRFAMEMTECQHYVLYMADESNEMNSVFSNIYQGDHVVEMTLPANTGIAGYALKQNKTINVKDPYADPNFWRDFDQKTGITTKSVLAGPIGCVGKSQAVIQLFNKKNGVFTTRDEAIMQLCMTYGTIVLSFDHLSKDSDLMKQEIAVLRDAFAYKSKPTKKQLRDIEHPPMMMEFPEDDLYSLKFNMYQHVDHFSLWFITMAKRLFQRCDFKCCDRVLLHFTASVRNLYHDLPYHNWEHAFSVAQSTINIIHSIWDKLKPLERIGIFIAAICHDVDHRGVNNAFLMKTKHPLSRLYARGSVLENHHSYMTEMVLSNKENDIFFSLDANKRGAMMKFVRKMIISTDLFTHFPRLERMQTLVSSKTFDWDNQKHRNLGAKTLMTISDLCGSFKPWEVHRLSTTHVYEEFYAQGARELKLGFQPVQMFVSREDFPINQLGFLNGIIKPLIDLMVPVIPVLAEVQPIVEANMSNWEELIAAQHVEENNRDSPDTHRKKIAEIKIPNSEVQRKSLSFVMYNCAGEEGKGKQRDHAQRRTSSIPKFLSS